MASKPTRGHAPPLTRNPHHFYTHPMQPVRAPSRPAQQDRARPASVRPPSRQIRPVLVTAEARPVVVPVAPARPYPVPSRPARNGRRRNATRKGLPNGWLIALVGAPLALMLMACMILSLGALALFGSGNVLPGVSSAGVALGGMAQAQAAQTLAATWSGRGVILRDGEREFPVSPVLLGVTLDAEASARAAVQFGRSSGGIGGAIGAVVGRVAVEPVVSVDAQAAEAGLAQIAAQIEQPAVNAGVQVVGGQVQPRPAVTGRALDIGATVMQLRQDPAGTLADGALELVIIPVQPSVTDAAPMVAAASALLANPLQIRAYDPVRDETLRWTLAPEQWSAWLAAERDDGSPLGLKLSLEPNALANYLNAQQSELGAGRYLKLDESIPAIQQAIAGGQTAPYVRVYHEDTLHTVQPGETIISIAWDYGVPYPWIQQANPDAAAGLSVGQTITVPSPDNFMDYPVVYDKRIVVSISQQHVWVYENGSLKWDWVASTGIASSPTWPGIYQIISHEPNAFAGNWNLWMPNFMGVYRPIPGADFTNGFHGFPTRDGYQLLWTNSLGTRVTYGCILLSDDHIQLLYDWAEEGVVVEIQA